MDDVEDRGLSTAPLDPIEVACAFNYEEGLPEYPFVNVAVASISDPTYFREHVLKQSARAAGTKRIHHATRIITLHRTLKSMKSAYLMALPPTNDE